jgi:hypothetical protein
MASSILDKELSYITELGVEQKDAERLTISIFRELEAREQHRKQFATIADLLRSWTSSGIYVQLHNYIFENNDQLAKDSNYLDVVLQKISPSNSYHTNHIERYYEYIDNHLSGYKSIDKFFDKGEFQDKCDEWRKMMVILCYLAGYRTMFTDVYEVITRRIIKNEAAYYDILQTLCREQKTLFLDFSIQHIMDIAINILYYDNYSRLEFPNISANGEIFDYSHLFRNERIGKQLIKDLKKCRA